MKNVSYKIYKQSDLRNCFYIRSNQTLNVFDKIKNNISACNDDFGDYSFWRIVAQDLIDQVTKKYGLINFE